MNKNERMDKNIPKLGLDCTFNEIALSLSDVQYQSSLKLVELLNNYTRDIKV
jgi:hypothetical protein